MTVTGKARTLLCFVSLDTLAFLTFFSITNEGYQENSTKNTR
jgi:hypothetical protein